MDVWVNGRFVSQDQASISVFDAGFQHGVGLFETMAVRNGRVFRLDRHLARLERSAIELRLMESLRTGPLAEAVLQTVERSGLRRARVRLTLSGGDLNLLNTTNKKRVDPTIVIAIQPPTAYPDELFQRGIRVIVTDARLNPLDPLAGRKSLNYWGRLMALQQAASAGAGEAIWFSISNHLVSGSVSNVFAVKNGVIETPIAKGEEAASALPSATLPGITREAIIELAGGENIEVRRRLVSVEDLLSADEAFLSNSSWGIMPISSVEQSNIGTGSPGPMTVKLMSLLREMIERESLLPDAS